MLLLHASKVDFSENANQNMGRWKSKVVKRHIRSGSFTVALDKEKSSLSNSAIAGIS